MIVISKEHELQKEVRDLKDELEQAQADNVKLRDLNKQLGLEYKQAAMDCSVARVTIKELNEKIIENVVHEHWLDSKVRRLEGNNVKLREGLLDAIDNLELRCDTTTEGLSQSLKEYYALAQIKEHKDE